MITPKSDYIQLIGVLGLGIVVLGFSIAIDKHLSADGVYYFVHILEHQTFTNTAWARRHAEFLTQLPLVIAVNLGIEDIEKLSLIFGAGMLTAPLLSFLLSAWALPPERKWFLCFPLSTFLIFSLQGDYLLVGEYHVLASLSWPALFLLLRAKTLRIHHWVVALVLLGILGRTYETALVMMFLYGGVLIRDLQESGHTRFFAAIGLAICIASILVSITFIFEPRSGVQRSSFLSSLSTIWKILEIRGILVFMGATLVSLCVTNVSRLVIRGRISCIVIGVGLFYLVYIVILSLTSDYERTAYWSFGVRTMTAWLLPLVAVVATILYRLEFRPWRHQIAAIAVASLLMFGLNVSQGLFWLQTKSDFTQILKDSSRPRLVEIGVTHLANNPYLWSWNNSLLSLVWSGGCVERLIVNKGQGKWAYNYEQTLILTRYQKFGASFRKFHEREVDDLISWC